MKSSNSLKWNWAWIQVGNLAETKQNPNVCETGHNDGYEQLLRVLPATEFGSFRSDLGRDVSYL